MVNLIADQLFNKIIYHITAFVQDANTFLRI